MWKIGIRSGLNGVGRAIAAFCLTLLAATGVSAQPAAPSLSWTDWADLALASPVILSGTVTDSSRLSRRDAPDLPPGTARVLVRVGLNAVLTAPGVLPAEAAWLWQGPVDARGRLPFARHNRLIVFARPLQGGADPQVQALQLVSAAAQQPWSPDAEAIARGVLEAARRLGVSELMVTGVDAASAVAGDIPGYSDSQFFLHTSAGRPLTLIVRRRPDQPVQILATTSELVDSAARIMPQTLLWRALACGLPPALPDADADSAQLAADYAAARMAIGDCGRTVVPPR